MSTFLEYYYPSFSHFLSSLDDTTLLSLLTKLAISKMIPYPWSRRAEIPQSLVTMYSFYGDLDVFCLGTGCLTYIEAIANYLVEAGIRWKDILQTGDQLKFPLLDYISLLQSEEQSPIIQSFLPHQQTQFTTHLQRSLVNKTLGLVDILDILNRKNVSLLQVLSELKRNKVPLFTLLLPLYTENVREAKILQDIRINQRRWTDFGCKVQDAVSILADLKPSELASHFFSKGLNLCIITKNLPQYNDVLRRLPLQEQSSFRFIEDGTFPVSMSLSDTFDYLTMNNISVIKLIIQLMELCPMLNIPFSELYDYFVSRVDLHEFMSENSAVLGVFRALWMKNHSHSTLVEKMSNLKLSMMLHHLLVDGLNCNDFILELFSAQSISVEDVMEYFDKQGISIHSFIELIQHGRHPYVNIMACDTLYSIFKMFDQQKFCLASIILKFLSFSDFPFSVLLTWLGKSHVLRSLGLEPKPQQENASHASSSKSVLNSLISLTFRFQSPQDIILDLSNSKLKSMTFFQECDDRGVDFHLLWKHDHTSLSLGKAWDYLKDKTKLTGKSLSDLLTTKIEPQVLTLLDEFSKQYMTLPDLLKHLELNDISTPDIIDALKQSGVTFKKVFDSLLSNHPISFSQLYWTLQKSGIDLQKLVQTIFGDMSLGSFSELLFLYRNTLEHASIPPAKRFILTVNDVFQTIIDSHTTTPVSFPFTNDLLHGLEEELHKKGQGINEVLNRLQDYHLPLSKMLAKFLQPILPPFMLLQQYQKQNHNLAFVLQLFSKILAPLLVWRNQNQHSNGISSCSDIVSFVAEQRKLISCGEKQLDQLGWMGFDKFLEVRNITVFNILLLVRESFPEHFQFPALAWSTIDFDDILKMLWQRDVEFYQEKIHHPFYQFLRDRGHLLDTYWLEENWLCDAVIKSITFLNSLKK